MAVIPVGFFSILCPSCAKRDGNRSEQNFAKRDGNRSEQNLAVKKDFSLLWESIDSLPLPDIPDDKSYYNGIETITECTDQSISKIERWLQSIKNSDEPVGFDFETESLRPYNGIRLSLAIGTSSKVIAFPLEHPDASWSTSNLRRLNNIVQTFFSESKCVKVAHNLSFDLEWLIHGRSSDWVHDAVFGDTQGAAYVLDERKAQFLQLDRVILREFGFRLKSLSGVDVTQLSQTSLDTVLRYNALDAKWTAAAFAKLIERVNSAGLMDVYDEHIRRTITVTLSQLKGLQLDQSVVQEFDRNLTLECADKLKQFQSLTSVKDFQKRFHYKANPLSTTDTLKLFRDVIKSKDCYNEETNSFSTNESVLANIDDPAAKLLVSIRSTNKLHSTYVKPLLPGG